MHKPSLEDLISSAGGPLNLLRAHTYDRADAGSVVSPPQIVPQIPQEFSLWEREARAWRESVALFDQTHHMQGLFLEGPDAQRLLTSLACNDLSKSAPNSAHQLICVNEDGQLIGDDIVFHLAENLFSIYGVPFALELGLVPRSNGRVQRHGDLRRAVARLPERPCHLPAGLPLPDSGAAGRSAHREAERRPRRQRQVLPLDRDQHRGHPVPGPAARHGGCDRA